MNIKRLELDGWMKSTRGFEDTIKYSSAHYTEIEPEIHRNGYFVHGKDCWFEVNGRAFTADKSAFDYLFNIVTVRELSKRETDALEAIVNARLATAEQKKLHGFHVLHGNKFNIEAARAKKRLKAMKKRMQEKRESVILAATTNPV